MNDIRLQTQCFALLGKARKQIQKWMKEGDKSPGALQAMMIQIGHIIKDIDGYIDELDDEETDI